jgi:ribonuclease VapC
VIVDTSAVLAILRDEPDAERYAHALASSSACSMSAATYVEAGVVVDANRDPVLSRRLDDLLTRAAVVIAPVTAADAEVARQAYRDYGKGTGHPARLNFGDCFSYALARTSRERLLFKGNDFVHTDVESALS